MSRYDAPVWVDNDVNIRALGELRAGLGRGERDLIYVKIGTGIGAGLISGGVLHRGAQGCAGDIGHLPVQAASDVVCRCGRLGCLEALAGAAAIAREANRAAREGSSRWLADVLEAGGGPLDSAAVIRGASHGDPTCQALLAESARLVGETLSRVVNIFNPALIVLGGRVALAGDPYLAAIRQAVLSGSLPLATRELRIARSPLGDDAGVVGAAFLVIDLLLSRDMLEAWIGHGSPHGMPELAELT